MKTGQRHEYIDGDQSVNTGNGQVIDSTPDYDYKDPAGIRDYGTR